MKDEDMHNFGGECDMFRQEDKDKREKEELLKKAKELEERKKIEIVQ
jgi:hypothetical protein